MKSKEWKRGARSHRQQRGPRVTICCKFKRPKGWGSAPGKQGDAERASPAGPTFPGIRMINFVGNGEADVGHDRRARGD